MNAVATACEALLSSRPPLAAALTLHRLSKGSTPMAAQEKKLQHVATSLSPETRKRLACEFKDDGLFHCAQALSSARNVHAITVDTPASKRACRPRRAAAAARLCECPALWARSRRYYAASGATAWTSGAVPCHISTSAFISSAYAAIVAGFMADTEASAIVADEPLIILDLGCGAGVLGVRVARELQRRGCRDFCVVLADLDPAAALAQVQLPPAASLVRDGLLDVAALDAAASEGAASDGLHLELSGRRVGTSSLRRPLVVLANYLFDSLPIELLRVRARSGVCAGVDALCPEADGRFAYRPIWDGRGADGRATSRAASQAMSLAAAVEAHFACPRQAALAGQLVAAAEAEAVAAAEQAAAHGDDQERAALAYVCTGAQRCLRAVHRLLDPSLDARMLLLVGDKLVDGSSAARLAATQTAMDAAPLTLSQLPLFSVHGSPTHGAVSHGVVLEALIEALPHGGCLLAQSAALMEFDVVALAVGSAAAAHGQTAESKGARVGRRSGRVTPHAEEACPLPATRRAFRSRLGRFGAAEMERLTAMVHEAAQIEGLALRRAARKAARQPSRPIALASATGDAAASMGGAAPAVALSLLTQIVVLSGYDWDVFASLRTHFLERFPSVTSAEAAEAISVATRCFDERVTLCAADWEDSGTIFKQWLAGARRRHPQHTFCRRGDRTAGC